jgi:hypothetical protein
MQFLAFLFFSTLLGSVAYLIRSTLIQSSDRIEAALAGEYRMSVTHAAIPYRARRHRITTVMPVRGEARRLAA